MSTTRCKLPFGLVCAGYFIAVIIITLPHSAFAEITKSQRGLEIEAKKACLAGESNYKKGIEVLAQLFAETNEPTYIYNQGRCYQQNNKPELALGRFQEYLRREPQMTSKEKSALESYVRECEALVVKTQPSQTTAAPTSSPINVKAPQEPAPTQTLAAPPIGPSTSSGRGLRIAGVTMTTISLVTLGGAVTLNWLQKKEEQDFKEGKTWTSNKQSNSNLYETLSRIGYVVGATTLATGITLYIIGWHSEKTEEPSLALVPSLFPTGATLSLRGTF